MTKFKEKHTAWLGSQLSYSSHITQPEDTREDVYCLTFPQSQALIAVIEHYRFLTRWLDDDPDNPLTFTLTNQFVDDTQRRLMMPCGSDNIIVLSQWTPNGHYQESTDGGTTYHDAPTKDPRNNVPLPPPFLPPDTVDASCTYADSIVNKLINDWINATGATEDQATVIEGVISFLAGVFGAFGVVAAAITLGIAILIVAFTVAAWKAAFVSDVWNRLRCNLKDHMGSDGTFTQEDVDAIYTQLGSDETGIVKISLQGMIAALGAQGLTIAARAGYGSPSADCEDCTCVAVLGFDPGGFCTILSIDDETCTLTLQSVVDPGNPAKSVIGFNFGAGCAHVTINSFDNPSIGTVGWFICGAGSETTGLYPAGSSVNYYYMQSNTNTTWTMEVTITP